MLYATNARVGITTVDGKTEVLVH
jgi:hypothetical protein